MSHDPPHERQPRQDQPNDDDAQALSRETGGVDDPSQPDQGSTTGTTPSEEFVGQATGQDVGYAGETGAERRAAYEQEQQQR